MPNPNTKSDENPFHDWIITQYLAKSPDEKHVFWIASGFSSFRDHDTASVSVLDLLPRRHRKRIWKMLMRERISRIDKTILNMFFFIFKNSVKTNEKTSIPDRIIS